MVVVERYLGLGLEAPWVSWGAVGDLAEKRRVRGGRWLGFWLRLGLGLLHRVR